MKFTFDIRCVYTLCVRSCAPFCVHMDAQSTTLVMVAYMCVVFFLKLHFYTSHEIICIILELKKEEKQKSSGKKIQVNEG